MARPSCLHVCPTRTRENAHVSPPLRLVWPAVPGGAGALSFSLLARSEPRFQAAPVQTQPALPVKPISRQQPQYLPLPAEALLRRAPRLGTISLLKVPDRSAQLGQNPAFARLQAGGRFGTWPALSLPPARLISDSPILPTRSGCKRVAFLSAISPHIFGPGKMSIPPHCPNRGQSCPRRWT